MPQTSQYPNQGAELPAIMIGTELHEFEAEPARPDPDFKIFGLDLEIIAKAAKSDDGKTRLRCIASSSVEDRHGDTMTEACVRGMRKQAGGLTIFLNHSYRFPEDVFGYVESASTKSEDGAVLLMLTIVADDTDERVARSISKIENGVKAGVSIGAMLTDYEYKDEDAWWGGLVINEVELLEASIVGIPANPKSWVDQVVKNFTTKGLIRPRPAKTEVKAVPKEIEQPTPEPIREADGPEEIVAAYVERIESGQWPTKSLEETLIDAVSQSVAWGMDNGKAKDFASTTVEDLVAQIMSQVAAPAESKDAGDESAAADAVKSEEEGATSTSDTDPDALEALSAETDSGTEDGDAVEAEKEAQVEIEKLAEAGVLSSLSDMTEVLEQTLIALSQARAEKTAAEEERDQIAAQLHGANDSVQAAIELIKVVMDMPVGRKTNLARVVEESDFAQRMKGSVYDDDVLALISKGGSA